MLQASLLPPVLEFNSYIIMLISTDLSLIAGDSTLTFDADFTLGDVMNSDPMLTFEPGIT